MIDRILKRITALSVRWKPLWAAWLSLVGVIGSIEHLYEVLRDGVRAIRDSADFKTLWADVADLIRQHEKAKTALS